ncbi:hypothetical protein LSG31_07390 [Fodinisporobacter ferrooxydans]|uniref:Sortilin N-terminal domain-containing protein n=1 Tax=Fodinisporobacter ferrooxydans TaxID=2901836 RepID=A0ABY4CRJ6_9BACL|nr:hypothetical protein LSG31_07390 [Alicyclobacillaceae bacterium MYW30-H2]
MQFWNMTKAKRRVAAFGAISIIALALSACGSTQPTAQNAQKVTQDIEHIHGLGYSADGQTLYLATHRGLLKYRGGSFGQPLGNDDLMGFSMTAKAMYASGHPGDNRFKNPLGLVKLDGQGNVTPLAFYGSGDFHHMAASYKTGTIYVYAEEDMNGLKKGLNYTQDGGKTWHSVLGKGIDGEIESLAIAPDKDGIVAVGTPKGLFMSTDYGNHFQQMIEHLNTTGLSFDLKNSNTLYIGGYDKTPIFEAYDRVRKQALSIPLPFSDVDSVLFISENPSVHGELTIGTYKTRVYQSANSGKQWNTLIDKGMIKK